MKESKIPFHSSRLQIVHRKMSNLKYDVAFAPVNKRLILLSNDLSKALLKKGISSTILKTSLIGKDHNGWGDLDDELIQEKDITFMPEINYSHHSNFFTYSFRVIRSRLLMRKSYKPNYKCLILFMDDYAESEVLIPLMKNQKIPVVLFQDGFFVKEKKYDFDLYSLGKFIRSRILPYFFTPLNYSENSDYIFSWSNYGFNDFLKKIKTDPLKIKIVGYPFKIVDKKLPIMNRYKKILILHSPLPSLKAEEADNKNYLDIFKVLDEHNFDIYFKAHPRVGFKKITNLINEYNKTGVENKPVIIDRKISSEVLYNDYDVLIMTPSAAAIEALYRGIPVIFLPNKHSRVELIEKLASQDKVILIEDINFLPLIIDKLNTDLSYRNKVITLGYEAARIIGGDLDVFDNNFPIEVSNILNKFEHEIK
ncbi:MAG: hypothetical protein CMD72_03960 [Gammaproteobacteria bacterium]|nr:hypothetical protein [Gammaproteobacteria bacterium]